MREHEDHVALYYALRRNADGMFNPATGKYDGISSAYRIRLSSAYVVDPEKPMDIPKLEQEEERKAAFEDIKQAVIKGADTRIPQDVPPGTTRDLEFIGRRRTVVSPHDRTHEPPHCG